MSEHRVSRGSIDLNWGPLIKVILGLGLLVVLLSLVDFDLLLKSISTASVPGIALGFLLFSMLGIFESGRLKIVFASFNIGVVDSIRLFLIGAFFGNFVPGSLGVDLYQVYQMNAIRPGLVRPMSLSLYLRLNGLILNIALAVFALVLGFNTWIEDIQILNTDPMLQNELLSRAVIMLLVIVPALVVVLRRPKFDALRSRLRSALNESVEVLRSFSIRQHVLVVLLGVGVVFCRAASIYALAYAFDSPIDGLAAILVVTVSTFVTLIPISFAGLGVSEISAAAILTAVGMSPTEAVAISLVSRAFIWALSLFGGAWFLFSGARSA